MNIVNWSFITNCEWGVDHADCVRSLLQEDYEPFTNLSKELISSRKRVVYLKCPAHTDFLKNTFVFRAPFDLTIDLEIDSATNSAKIYCENISQEIFDLIIDRRFLLKNKQEINTYPLLGVDWLSVFTAKESTLIQVLPAFMHHNNFTEKTTIIPGEYDISKWTRPIETVFEIRSNKEKIVIKKGDAISYIKFLTKDTVKLIKNPAPWDQIKLCNEIRQSDTFRPLAERYKSLEEIKSNQECPYDSKNK
jgi:hypothetical protein